MEVIFSLRSTRTKAEPELYLYSDRYGPTNEKLAVYLRDLYNLDHLGHTKPAPLPRVSTLESQR